MSNELVEKPKASISVTMAEKFGMESAPFLATLRATIMPNGRATNEEVGAFLIVAKQYDLNPFTKEIYAFKGHGGGIQPMVSVDGWLKIVNAHPQFDGMNFTFHEDPHG